MALTGPLAPNGKQALLGAKIWEEETNKKGGLLGRPVKIVYYDDQSNPSTVPGIYTKLLDVDKVDLVVGPYATAMTTKIGKLESKDELKRRIDQAAKYAPLDQLCISGQCGFASTEEGNRIGQEDQQRKLDVVGATARAVWGGQSGSSGKPT